MGSKEASPKLLGNPGATGDNQRTLTSTRDRSALSTHVAGSHYWEHSPVTNASTEVGSTAAGALDQLCSLQ